MTAENTIRSRANQLVSELPVASELAQERRRSSHVSIRPDDGERSAFVSMANAVLDGSQYSV
ncbi:hypothetical protein N7495_006785 [Penicillium taxi]|uniref:uncharacterized protein n=1 Tax=Penicillium taxi TaxID=168475 RepID=UPI0025452453|nr:uncharacterized protein N7495_006785 [Penicillium taxi]KAJ5895094.1 hypothetical protein N7495_006785 [Penicillium taxi]